MRLVSFHCCAELRIEGSEKQSENRSRQWQARFHGTRQGEAARMKMKRKIGEEPRNWDDGGSYNAASPKAPTAPLCTNVRSPRSTDTTTQPVSEDVAICNRSFEMSKRSRMEAAGKSQMNPVRPGPFADDNLKSAANSRPSHREHGMPFVLGLDPKPPREIIDHVPNEKRGKIQDSLTQVAWQGNNQIQHQGDFASAGGALDFGVKLQFDETRDPNVMSLNMTEGFLRAVRQIILFMDSICRLN